MIEQVIARRIAETGAERADFLGVGIGSPGPLDRERGIVIVAPNLGWRNFPLRDAITSASGCRPRSTTTPTARRSASGGAVRRAAAQRGRHDDRHRHRRRPDPRRQAVSRLVRRGRRDRPHDHRLDRPPLQVRQLRLPRGLRVGAGDRRARARGAGARRENRCSSRWSDGDSRRHHRADRVRRGQRRTTRWRSEVVRDTARFLGAGIANLLNIFNPDVVVLAGGVTQAGDALFEPLRAEVRRRAFKPAVEACRIVPGRAAPLGRRRRRGRHVQVADARDAVSAGDPSPAGAPARKQRLGVIGTFVWDVIHGRDPRDAAGGGVGRHHLRAERARRGAAPTIGSSCRSSKSGTISRRGRASFCATLRHIAPDAALDRSAVPEQSRRAPLLEASERRSEQLTGGVPAGRWLGLKPLLARPRRALRELSSAAGSSISRPHS